MKKKKIIFSVPLHLKQGVKVRDGEMLWDFQWDIFERFFRFIKGLFPRIYKKEVGAVYSTLREGYYWIGVDGQIERRELPEINEELEELVKSSCLSISLNESEQNGSIMSLEKN